GLFPAQAYAIVNGGPLEPAQKSSKPVPLMLLSAQDDAQVPKMKELHDGLAKVGWPHAFCTRPGAHPLAREDIEASVRFFRRDLEGSLKPTPTGYPCEGGATSLSAATAEPATPRPKK